MTIAGWITFAIIALIVAAGGTGAFVLCEKIKGKVISVVVALVLIVGILLGFLWYFNNTASGRRELVDQKSNLNNGIERTVTVYTADGEIIAQYTGNIDIESSDGGYVKFDFEGKRYIYYNCFVETIAEID